MLRRAAVIGSPIGHSLSPVLHTAAYRALGLADWSYDRFAVGGPGEPDLATFLAGLDAGIDQWAGLSLTMPLKEAALEVAMAVSPDAAQVGGANTLIPVEGGWIGHTTDGWGLYDALADLRMVTVGSVLLLGSGATARSALQAVAARGCRRVTFAVRDQVRGPSAELAKHLGMTVDAVPLGDHEAVAQGAATAELTVSALPTGTDLVLPVLARDALAGRTVLDVVYGGWPTPLARWACAAGARVVSGLPMLLHQAAKQVELMTGRPAPLGAMRAAVAELPGAWPVTDPGSTPGSTPLSTPGSTL